MNQYAVVALIMSALKSMHHILAISPFVLASCLVQQIEA